ncbi:PREDICTED: uncharacterized protein LOC108565833 [Nicrophorus vespilloides]|uniref:Uncharacterized protein LOC108565833 n=1 Tax=Nicrophorus vespilloides TaxID=110193 RepID=A0ABM1N2B8_NICVS|nr:PREDICTED: uncharacterized protein LOC108565833 [Nicrophorus vespilloides]
MLPILLLISFAALAYSDLAQLVKPCNRTGDINACLLNNLESAKEDIINGIPELMIPNLKVIFITHSSINITNLKIDLWNFNITGLEKFVIKSIDTDLNNRIIKVTIMLPYLDGIGSYKIKGNLFNLNLDSMGELTGNATNSILHYTLRLTVAERNRDFHLMRESQEFKINMKSGVFYCHFDNLYLGSNELTETMNRIINHNSYYMFEMLIPFLENILDDIVGNAIDLVFARYSFDEMFP